MTPATFESNGKELRKRGAKPRAGARLNCDIKLFFMQRSVMIAAFFLQFILKNCAISLLLSRKVLYLCIRKTK